MVNMVAQVSSIEENVFGSKEGESSMDPNCRVEKLSESLQSCEQFCLADNDSYKSLIGTDISGTDVLVCAFNSASISEPYGQGENEGKYNVGTDDASEAKSPDITCSSPQRRSTRVSKLNQKTDTKKAAGNCRQTTNIKLLLDMIFLNVARKRRSRFCKRVCSSVWGSLEDIGKGFEQNTWLDVNQHEHKKSQKSVSGRGGGKRNKNQTDRSSQKSKGKSDSSAGRIRLKVKLGRKVGESHLTDVASVIDEDLEKYWGTPMENPILTKDVENKLEEEVPRNMDFQCCDNDMEKTVMLSDASISNLHLADKEVSEKSTGNAADNHHQIPPQEEVEALVVTVDNRDLDQETSPDSEVINLLPDVQISGRMHGVLISSQSCVDSGDVTSLSLPQMNKRKGNKKDKLHQSGYCCVDGRFPSPEIEDSTGVLEKHGQREKMGDGSYSSEASVSTTNGNAYGNMPSSGGFSIEPLPSSRVTDFGVSETLKVESGTEVDLFSSLGVGLESPESQMYEKLPPHTRGQKLPESSRSRGVSKSRSKVPHSASRRGDTHRKKGNQEKSVRKSKVKEKGNGCQVVCKMDSHPETGHYILGDQGETNTESISRNGDIDKLDMQPSGVGEQSMLQEKAWVCCDDCSKWRRIPEMLADSIGETNCRWVCKDNMDKDFADCSIPQEKSNSEINAELEIYDAFGEEDACYTRLSPNKLGHKQLTAALQSFWTRIKSNLYLHRNRKTQTIDEIMVCHCKPPSGGRMGCGDGCLNRMLNIECIRGTCPCGELCSNKQFQEHKYAKLTSFRCGKKGYGLQLLEDISEGRFLIEYVGEVLDMHAYESRQREYALKGHKHFYFMTLNGSEVIDACAKGNLGRFINHSCDPNCRTEKWMVNGEVCIGLFALRDIKKGEEVTFDYNYVRVFGAAANKCVCGSSQCRGFIGGDPLNTEVIVQGDSDEEYPEPIMICEPGEIDDNFHNIISSTTLLDSTEMRTAKNALRNEDVTEKPAEAVSGIETTEILLKEKDETDVGRSVITTENEELVNRSAFAASVQEIPVEMEGCGGQLPSSIQPVEIYLHPDDVTSETMSAAEEDCTIAKKSVNNSFCPIKKSEISSDSTKLSKLLPETTDTKRKSKSDMEEERRTYSKSRPLVKTPRSSSVRKGKSSSTVVNVKKPLEMDNKSHRLSFKSKKPLEGSSSGHFEAVQDKLNELLDPEGGISKRKDATRGYLKLLLLTAASGDSGNGEAIQSNRDLSMILGALLKTKSRSILVDVMNKNGLQMLHNIMKRYSRVFNKIPILRKLLKVLEYLARREILKLEHINAGPSRPGVESFRESILTLTAHTDKEVHQTARGFRDRWITRLIRKDSCMDREDSRMELNRSSNCNRLSASRNRWCDQSRKSTEALDCIKQSIPAITPLVVGNLEDCSASCSNGCITNGTKTRKRKSRWDQPAETNQDSRSHYKESGFQSGLVLNSYSSPKPEIGEVKLDHIYERSREDRNCHSCTPNFIQQTQTKLADDKRQNINEDVPPGFSHPLTSPLFPSSAASIAMDHNEDVPPGFSHPHTGPLFPSSAAAIAMDHNRGNVICAKGQCEVAMGHPQERFNSRFPVSYGIPFPVVQQLGSPQAETVEGWVVAPGMPFHPFPPLPPYSRNKRDPPPCAANPMKMSRLAETNKLYYDNPTSYHSDQNTPSISGRSPGDVEIPGVDHQHNFQQGWGSSYSLERKYFRQEKWNNSKSAPPWIRKSNDCVGGGANDLKGLYSSVEVRTGVESSGNTFQ